MLDFSPVQKNEMTLNEMTVDLEWEDLAVLTNEMIDYMLAQIAGCTDFDVTFEPADPDAFDPDAQTESEKHMPWTLGHLIAHVTASAEESAFLAAELARGVEYHGRSRYEVPWQTITTINQCRNRLEESRRMRLASLETWPDEPHLDNFQLYGRRQLPFNAITRFVSGLLHDTNHLGQIAEVVRQAHAVRNGNLVPAGI